jgi:hypothetical protein
MTYNAYYLSGPDGIVAGPFATVDTAVEGKKKFVAPFASLLTVVKSTIEAEPV